MMVGIRDAAIRSEAIDALSRAMGECAFNGVSPDYLVGLLIGYAIWMLHMERPERRKEALDGVAEMCGQYWDQAANGAHFMSPIEALAEAVVEKGSGRRRH
jgi:hypothetical protein